MNRRLATLLASFFFIPWISAPTVRAEVPYPACALPTCDPACALGDEECTGPDDWADYLFVSPGTLPSDYAFDPENPGGGSGYLFEGTPDTGPAAGVRTGHDVVGAWQISTGRPDVVSAVLDSGIRWSDRGLAPKLAPNVGELPLPAGCDASYDCDGNGVVNVEDFAGAACGPGLAQTVDDANENGFLDGQDLIVACSDGVDDDANGFVDDIAGWDFFQDDNDPSDDVDYGHGTGQASDQVAQANDGGGQPGVAPASMFVPLRVGDSFVAIGSDFTQAVVYAADHGVSLISEALGTVTAEGAAQRAVDHAVSKGIPIIASAADEQSRHHNLPALLEHTIFVNSVRPADGGFIAEKSPPEFTLQNGCTNHGGKAWVAIGSKACSSEATGRAAGLVSLLIAQGRNLIDRGELAPYPGLTTPFSAEEVRQILRASADDIDHTADPTLPLTVTAALFLGDVLSDPSQGLILDARHFETQPGWDQYTGYGRPDAVAMLSVTDETIPPEADLSGGTLSWFDVVDPVAEPSIDVVGSVAAVRAAGLYDWTLEVGCGVQPMLWLALANGSASVPLTGFSFHAWAPADTASGCGFDPSEPIEDPDAHTVTMRLRVHDSLGNLGEDRRTLAIHHDPTLAFPPVDLSSSGEASATLADVDGDEVLDIVYGTSGGLVFAMEGAAGTLLDGFPVHTDPLPVHPSPGFAPKAGPAPVPVPFESLVASPAVDDLDDDGELEIVVASTEGKVYVFGADGARRPGFPVATDATRSASSLRDRYNDLDPGISGAPTLADLDPPGVDPALEILVGAWDGHLYAWRHDGTPVDGFPVKLADRARVDVDAKTGAVTPLDAGVQSRLAKIVSSPAVGDLDGDGQLEIVATTNEEYEEGTQGFDADSAVFAALELAILLGAIDDVRLDVAGRLYVLHADGTFATTLDGKPTAFPVPVPMLVSGLLPNVATGVPGSPALADVDGDGQLEIAIFGAVGPAVLFDAWGASVLPDVQGRRGTFAIDFPDVAKGGDAPGFPAVPETAGSPDAPFFPGLGSGAFGDLDGDHAPEYVAPTAGLRVLMDALLPGSQEFSHHQIAAWHGDDGSLLPAFPRLMDDMQFLTSPSLGDVSGDGLADVVNGSGGYLVRAYTKDGETPPGFPKFTHGWLISTPAIGDVDGDGLNEVVAATREGRLFVWNTDGVSTPDAIPWQSAGRDRRNTQNLESGVPTVAPEPSAGASALAGLFAVAALRRALSRWGGRA